MGHEARPTSPQPEALHSTDIEAVAAAGAHAILDAPERSSWADREIIEEAAAAR